jgi:flagellar motor switch protein FliM
MADYDDVDQEALAAEWGMEGEDESEGEGEGADSNFDDDVAAQWAAMIDEGEEEEIAIERGGAERILNQEEIDGLLGFQLDKDRDGDISGIRAIIESGLISYERLPMLEIVFDRLVRLMTTSLRNFTSDNVEVSLDSISSIRFGDYLNSIPLPAILSVFKIEEWDNYGLFTVNSSLIYSIVDVLLGGRRSANTMRAEGRPYTTIESALVEQLIEVALDDVRAAFEPLAPLKFTLDRLETNPRFAVISRPENASILVKLRIDMEDRGGRIELVLPYATLEPIRELLVQMFVGEKFGQDTIWEGHLATELWSTQVAIDAVLDQLEIPLHDVMKLEIGQTLMLNATPDAKIDLRCGGVPLANGKMGRVGDNISVRVEKGLTERVRQLASAQLLKSEVTENTI